MDPRSTGPAFAALTLVVMLMAPPLRADATWREHSSDGTVDLFGNCFHVKQTWLVRGATRAQLLEACQHLTLSGRYGVYGDRQLVTTEVPEARQNGGHGVDAWAHPAFVPVFLGSRATTTPTPSGFRASMSGGTLGRGVSEVTFRDLPGNTVEITERGTYSLARLETGAGPVDVAYDLGAATFGRLPLAAAHKTMASVHNAVFNAAEPLVNWINDRAAGRTRDPGTDL